MQPLFLCWHLCSSLAYSLVLFLLKRIVCKRCLVVPLNLYYLCDYPLLNLWCIATDLRFLNSILRTPNSYVWVIAQDSISFEFPILLVLLFSRKRQIHFPLGTLNLWFLLVEISFLPIRAQSYFTSTRGLYWPQNW